MDKIFIAIIIVGVMLMIGEIMLRNEKDVNVLREEHARLEHQHEVIYKSQLETYKLAKENGTKLDLLLNIATNCPPDMCR